jgi:hypothetical protein
LKDGESEMEMYSRFSWAVPQAFGAAISSCRFEQGDVLYSDTAAYDDSNGGVPPSGAHIQVLDPPRSARAISGDAESQRFFANWESPIQFEWMDYAAGKSEVRTSTQGRVFTCLWRGEQGGLDPDRESPDPPRPFLLRDLHGRVEESIPEFQSYFGGTKRPKAKGRMLFAMATDHASDTSRVKAESVVMTLRSRFEVTWCDRSPAEVGLADGDCFHPSLFVRGFSVETDDAEGLRGSLKDLLYGGNKDLSSEDARFQLARHGVLVDMDSQQGSAAKS